MSSTDNNNNEEGFNKVTVKTLPLNHPITMMIYQAVGENVAKHYADKHNVDVRLIPIIKNSVMSKCLYCHQPFYCCEPVGLSNLDHRGYFCTRGCRQDWNVEQSMLQQTKEDMAKLKKLHKLQAKIDGI